MYINEIKKLKFVKFLIFFTEFYNSFKDTFFRHRSSKCDFTHADSTPRQEATHSCLTTEKAGNW